MKTKVINLTLNQGADFSVVLRFSDQNGPKDLTGYSFLGEVRKNTAPSADPPLAEFAFEILNQVTNKGQVKWSLPSTSIAAIVASIATALSDSRLTTPLVYDVKMEDAGGLKQRIIQGLAKVSPQATQEEFP